MNNPVASFFIQNYQQNSHHNNHAHKDQGVGQGIPELHTRFWGELVERRVQSEEVQ